MKFLSKASQELLYLTPVKLSQVSPAEVLIIGCDKRPELPVMIKIQQKKKKKKKKKKPLKF